MFSIRSFAGKNRRAKAVRSSKTSGECIISKIDIGRVGIRVFTYAQLRNTVTIRHATAGKRGSKFSVARLERSQHRHSINAQPDDEPRLLNEPRTLR